MGKALWDTSFDSHGTSKFDLQRSAPFGGVSAVIKAVIDKDGVDAIAV